MPVLWGEHGAVGFQAKHCPFPAAGPSETVLSKGLAFDRQPIALLLEGAPDMREKARGAGFFRNHAKQANRFRAIHYDDGELSVVALPETRENFTFAQRLPNGGWLMVRPRSTGPEDHNAHRFDRNGRLELTFYAGDAIKDVQVTPSGNVWLSYFDEGIFGEQPLGPAGIERLSMDGEINRSTLDVTELDMADCYALNAVSDDEVWCCYYRDFPVARIGETTELIHETTGLQGVSAIAVGEEGLLLAGEYENPSALHWMGHKNHAARRTTVFGPDDMLLMATPLAARGNRLLVTADDELFTIDVQ